MQVDAGAALEHKFCRLDGDITWVAVPEFDAPVVADGVRRNLVSLVLMP